MLATDRIEAIRTEPMFRRDMPELHEGGCTVVGASSAKVPSIGTATEHHARIAFRSDLLRARRCYVLRFTLMRIAWVVGSVVVASALSIGTSWVVTERRVSRLEAHFAEVELDDSTRIRNAYIEGQQAMFRVEKVETTLASVQSDVSALIVVENDRRTTHREVRVAAPAQIPQSQATDVGGWWCHLGRECFRRKDDCPGDCRKMDTAFCGGKDGNDCFGDFFACGEHVESLGTFNGYGMNFPADVKQTCVRVE